jgi:hypothetical protein
MALAASLRGLRDFFVDFWDKELNVLPPPSLARLLAGFQPITGLKDKIKKEEKEV